MQRELIDKYFRNECSDEERRQVLEYFRNNPGEWDKYATEEDWDKFDINDQLAPDLTERLFDNVSRQTFRKRSKIVFYRIAAAACIVLLAGAIWMYFSGRPTYVAKRSVTNDQSKQLTERSNISDTLMQILLDDGSVVLLSPKSSIRYKEPFMAAPDRDVYLAGKALFEVSKDKSRPFIVHADRLATTVLGTSFTVESFEESTAIKVTLHKGKIQVAAVNNIRKKWNGREILKPGDEFIYDKITMLASVTRYVPAEKLVKAGLADNKGRSVNRPDYYTFDMSPLSEVFDQLSVYYQVDIYYFPTDIQNKYFTGRMRKTDALETILSDIAVLNQLKIEKKDEHYVIGKKD
ncbi:FecR family protein [Chitinophaga rhizophila]|uniref:FecR domain-containing protein n=1 Tax=Chitinophaga rhizophila TaxID=2866212 RepID=A0ABS7G6L2_9BACT|nr:FecR family protein [Chitinophaga rhizophila]MBW8683291.1 FecR domain-containing protein [Chitinophaga rhizophila]